MREESAGIIIYRKTLDGPKFLLLYHRGSYWNFPKGAPEEKRVFKDGKVIRETSFKAALREVWEETGLGSNDLRFKTWFKTYDQFIYTRDKQKVFKVVIYYLAETTKREIKISYEHNGYGWFLFKDALKILSHKNLQKNLKNAYDAICGKSLPRSSKGPQG